MEQAKHIDMQTPNGAELNIDALYKIAPSCFTEAKGEDGEMRRVVNWDKLRLLLGDNAVEDAPEVYDFTWVGKRAALQEAAAPINKTLRPCPEESVDWDNTQNLYIEGDNLEVLKLLQNSYMGKVKMIYIDPPYNTGNDFVYHDDFAQSAEEYNEASRDEEGNRYRKNTDSNGRFHSDWCSMIYTRLMVARSLLTEDGVIFISIDDNEVENLKKICNEIFGESNFKSQISWQKRYTRSNNTIDFTTVVEHIIVFSKSDQFVVNLLPRTDEADNRYSNPDNDPRGPWKGASFLNPATPSQRPNLCYPITNPNTGEVTLNTEHAWRRSKEVFEQLQVENKLYWGIDGKSKVPSIKMFLSEARGLTPINFWDHEYAGNTDNGSAELLELMETKVFDFPKPVKLIRRVLEHSTNKDDLILDFFSGSATSAQSVMQLNAEDAGKRKFIMVQWPEEIEESSEAYKAGFKNICEIGKERIRRAGKKIKEESPLTSHGLDTGFRVFKCESSNYKDVAFAPKDYSQDMLAGLLDNIKEERSDLDLLFDCMLRWGVELSLPLSSQKVGGCTIHNVNDGDLVACFDGSVTEDVIDAIAALSPVRVVFRDSSFNEAANKMNLFELFKQKCDWSDEEVRNNVRVI